MQKQVHEILVNRNSISIACLQLVSDALDIFTITYLQRDKNYHLLQS